MYDNSIHLQYVSLLRDSPLEGPTKVPHGSSVWIHRQVFLPLPTIELRVTFPLHHSLQTGRQEMVLTICLNDFQEKPIPNWRGLMFYEYSLIKGTWQENADMTNNSDQ